MTAYPNKGAMFPITTRKSDKSPDFGGYMKFDKDYLKSLKPDENGLLEVRISCWKSTSAAGNEYMSLKVDTYEPKKEENPW
jgi:hypothetical protein